MNEKNEPEIVGHQPQQPRPSAVDTHVAEATLALGRHDRLESDENAYVIANAIVALTHATLAVAEAQRPAVSETPTPEPVGYVVAAVGDWVPAGPSIRDGVYDTVEEARAEARRGRWTSTATGVQILALTVVEEVAL